MLENVKVQLSHYTITVPMHGRGGMVALKRGNSIKANDLPLVTVSQIRPLYVSVALPENGLPELGTAMAQGPVAIRVLSRNDKSKPIDSEIAFFDNAIDTTFGTINVRAIFPNEDQCLWPKQSVNVAILMGVDPGGLVVPPIAVEVRQHGNYVFVTKRGNTGQFFIQLKPRDERKLSVSQIIEALCRRMAVIPRVKAFFSRCRTSVYVDISRRAHVNRCCRTATPRISTTMRR